MFKVASSIIAIQREAVWCEALQGASELQNGSKTLVYGEYDKMRLHIKCNKLRWYHENTLRP